MRFWRGRRGHDEAATDDGATSESELTAEQTREQAGEVPDDQPSRDDLTATSIDPGAVLEAADESTRAPDERVILAPTAAPEPIPTAEPEETSAPVASASIAAGVERSRTGFVGRLRSALRGGGSDEAWEEVEEVLIGADLGAQLAIDVVSRARRRAGITSEEAIQTELTALFATRETALWPRKPAPDVPAVILVVGVNGTGKTTTIAKLAYRFKSRGARVLLAAGDTFRAAAIEQLQTWADRIDVPAVAHAAGADPAAVVYDALDAAAARQTDVLIIDTAGRLHTKSNLMQELAKIRRTISKRLPEATPEVLFVLDATTGQNGLTQARAFHEATGLTGIALTKLDSTAKGGIAFAIEEGLGVPVLFVGVGERMEDLLDFSPDDFVRALFA